jgi:ketosteroid isomerase-like protein
MDIIDRHFAAENAHDVQATLDTYTDDIVWDDVTNPDSPFRGRMRSPASTRGSSTRSRT